VKTALRLDPAGKTRRCGLSAGWSGVFERWWAQVALRLCYAGFLGGLGMSTADTVLALALGWAIGLGVVIGLAALFGIARR